MSILCDGRRMFDAGRFSVRDRYIQWLNIDQVIANLKRAF